MTIDSWALRYYYQGLPSWSWYFPYFAAPLPSDMVDLVELHQRVVLTVDTPLLPFQQLLAVLPAASADLLPKCIGLVSLTVYGACLKKKKGEKVKRAKFRAKFAIKNVGSVAIFRTKLAIENVLGGSVDCVQVRKKALQPGRKADGRNLHDLLLKELTT